jgi:hypothetical protein
MEASAQIHASVTLTPRERQNQQNPAAGAPEHVCRRDKFLALPGMETQFPSGPKHSHYSDWATQTLQGAYKETSNKYLCMKLVGIRYSVLGIATGYGLEFESR